MKQESKERFATVVNGTEKRIIPIEQVAS